MFGFYVIVFYFVFVLCDIACVELFNREYQIPVFPPDDVTVVNGELLELLLVQILVVLRVGMCFYEFTDIDALTALVVEYQFNGQVTSGFCLYYPNCFHRLSCFEYVCLSLCS